jgi:phosphoribosylformylglycinamidine synthase
VAISELCLSAGTGCDLDVPELAARGDITLFGEACGNVLVTCAPADRERVAALAAQHAVPVVELGRLGGERIVVRAASCRVDVALGDARAAYEDALPLAMEAR